MLRRSAVAAAEEEEVVAQPPRAFLTASEADERQICALC